MYIISKFRDYYDVGMKSGIDKTVVYERNTVEVKGKVISLQGNGWHGRVLAFCGKFYPFVYHVGIGVQVDRIIWDVEEAVATLPKSRWRLAWDDDRLDSEIGIRRFFDRKYPELEKLYHEYRTPVFAFEPRPARVYRWQREGEFRSLVFNPCLKDIQFYKAKDPITAFQEIYMFISGVIGSAPKPREIISDEVMAASKGHDGEYSFRKPPGKRGKKRWR